jgi:hypothetical protein
MSYAYRGDYYRGDYYRGDLWGSIVSGVKKIATVGGDIASGNFGKALGDAFGSGTNSGGTSGPPAAPGTGVARLGTPPRMPVPAHAGPGATETAGGVVTTAGGIPGYHWNKSNEYCNGAIVTAKHSKLVRNRSMNATNVKALRRADRRARAFLHIAKSVTRHYVAKQPKGRAYVHARRRKRA